MRTIVGASANLSREIERTLAAAGARGRPITCGAIVGYEYALPSSRGIYRTRVFIAPPTEVGGRFGRRLKRRLKKLVKSKALRALGKVARRVAAFVPYGSAVVETADMAAKAAKAIKAARVSGDPRLMAATAAALDAEAERLRRLRSEWR